MFVLPLIAFVLAAPVMSPVGTVKAGNDEMKKLMASDAATVEALAAKADDFVDFAELAKRSLGDDWKKLKAKQQADFSDTMKGLLRANYAQKALADGKGGQSAQEYGAETIKGNEATVATTLLVGADRYPVEYRLFRSGTKGAWRIFDVVTNDVSLVTTYRDQFRQLMAKKGFDGLLSTLRS